MGLASVYQFVSQGTYILLGKGTQIIGLQGPIYDYTERCPQCPWDPGGQGSNSSGVARRAGLLQEKGPELGLEGSVTGEEGRALPGRHRDSSVLALD